MKYPFIVGLTFASMSLLAVANDVPVSDADEMPPEIAALAAVEKSQSPIAPVSKPAPSTGMFEEETSTQQMVQADPSAGKSDLIKEVQTLQNELKQLRGQMELQKHDVDKISQQQNAIIRDLEAKLAAKGGAVPATPAVNTNPEAVNTVSEKDAEANRAYQEAFVLVRDKKYAEATAAMEAFVKAYLDSQYTPNAHYWLGELYATQGLAKKSIEQFQKVIAEYPNSGKAPAAMLKMGYSFYEQSRWQQARMQFNKILQNYPNSAEATLAKGRLRELDQQGL